MATKSPGIYAYEHDNTAYENPKSTFGTEVCIIGFAKKGPIGVPTSITSYNDYKTIFGKPVEGYYSSLAVKNVLTAGGKVLFVRVADETASASNVVIKNEVLAKNGKTIFDRAGDILIGTAEYTPGSLYGLKITNKEGEFKNIIVRAPSAGKLTQNSVLEQITNGLKETAPYYEVLKDSSKTVNAGIYSFKVNNGDDTFFVKTTNNESGNILAQSIQNILSKGSNAYCYIPVTNDDGDIFDIADTSALVDFCGKTRKFVIEKGDINIPVSIAIPSNFSLVNIADTINEVIAEYDVRCIAVAGDTENHPKLMFIGEETNIAIKSANTTNIEDEFFVTKTDGIDYFVKFDASGSAANPGLFAVETETETRTINTKGEPVTDITVEYNENTSSIIFIGATTGSSETISINESEFGNFIFDSEVGCNFGIVLGAIAGTDELTGLTVYRDSETKKITFETENDVDYPILENGSSGTYIKNLITIEKDPNVITSTGVTNILGNYGTEAKYRDIVVATSLEKGSATNEAIITFASSTSPVTGITKHDVTISVNGVIKETYEDVSLTYEDVDNRFDTLINADPDNGGSNILHIKVIKNDLEDPEIQVKDGSYQIGIANFEGAIKKTADIDITAYNEYDYMLGEDGIPTDGGDELFEEVLETQDSALSDQDLYDYHILIAPDNISENVQNAMINLCESRKDCICIIDPPVGLSKSAVIDWHNGKGFGRSTPLDTTYAAMYWTWGKVYDSDTKKNIWVMPSVVEAAKWVTVDKTAGCWFAPAGEQNGRMSFIDIEQSPGQPARDDLYTGYNRINPFVKYNDGNIICLGEKTLSRINSTLTKIHTRRMLIQIKKECKKALRPYLFLPLDPDMLGKISSTIIAILEKYKVGKGIESYTVVCDSTNNTTETMQQDIAYVDIGVTPRGVLEQVEINLNLNKTNQTVREV